MRHQCSKSVLSWSDTCRHQHEDIQLVPVARLVLGLTTSDSVLNLLPTQEIFTPPPVTVSIVSGCAREWRRGDGGAQVTRMSTTVPLALPASERI